MSGESRVNDPLLEPLRHIADEAAREHMIERILIDIAEPLARRITSRYTSAAAALAKEDAEDVLATITLALVGKLRLVAAGGVVVHDFEAYLATLTYNAVHDHLRRRYPERTRLKKRIRYVLTYDERLAAWTTPAGDVAGLAAWGGSHTFPLPFPLQPYSAARSLLRRDRPADAIVEILAAAGGPMLVEVLFDGLAELWNVTDAPMLMDVTDAPGSDASSRVLETRDFLRALWREIGALPLPQRKALLLNLRDSETVNVISILTLSGVATFDEIASAMNMSAAALGELWNQLPLDDASIATMLGLTRQQVINLRKSARERLARRMFPRKR
jgi:DNA-directed RNA polymerase specialized sigma24 family protein